VIVVVSFALLVAGLSGAAVLALSGGGQRHSRAVPETVTSNPVSEPSTSTSTSTTPTTAPFPPPTPVAIPPGPVAPIISKITTPNRVGFFTIDDGFVQDPAVVDYLRQNQIPFTMFVLPAALQQNPTYFQTLHQLGATVQDHTVHHLDLTRLSYQQQVNEICGPLAGDAFLFGQRPWLFRPPNGSYNRETLQATRTCGLQAVVLWEGTMNDGVLRLQHPGPLQPGDIILMHFRTDLLQNLKNLSAAAYLTGLRVAPLEQYLPPPTP
jgi:peptidoglycan/xylan/chitin deacetylase (PgdA/CDA1 family)